ncbi:zinc finger protein 592 [Nerophis ophidion]|uniref:zinc finger protein 592 n=1 Tax=Nerophis ophidion TaxID=159077 RepID=UPI002ADFBD18|nr:zinc finger protein 592 [Nerophis ophidion]
MGDMKTPDFDDLLAAFDIPDATGLDSKESTQEGNDDKHTNDTSLSDQANIPAMSVIVKNAHRHEPSECFGNGLRSGLPALHNGFNMQGCSDTANGGFPKSFVSALNGEFASEFLGKAPVHLKPDATPMFSQSLSHSSPTSSPECEVALSRKDNVHPKQERSCFPEASVLVEPSIADNPKKSDLCMFDDFQKVSPRSEEPRDSGAGHKMTRTNIGLPPLSSNKSKCKSETSVDDVSQIKPYTSKSCFETLVALNARMEPGEQPNPREPPAIVNDCMKYSPKVPISPHSPMSPLEAVKRLMKPPDSPISICSDSSGKASPALTSGSPPVIPKVRIKTIKTTSGQVKRTVTSVLPDSETDDVHSAYESSPSQSLMSEDGAYSPQILQSKEENRKLEATEPASSAALPNSPVQRSAAARTQKQNRAPSANFLPKAVHLASLNLVPHSVAASVTARSASHQPSQHTLSSTVYSTVPLVHQIKACPRTSVPNTAASTLNRLLKDANPVPTYVPDLNPPPGSDIRLPPRGYSCLECGDSFGLERSLAYHYGRKSVHIEVGCTLCAKSMVFYNKCALLAHARSHKSKGTVMQCTQLHMKPIAEAHMFAPLSTEPVQWDSKSASSSLGPLKSQPVMPLYPDNVSHHRHRCLECNKPMAGHRQLASHYQSLSEDKKAFICKLCSMLLPNKCSLRAHQRIHTHKSPHCCPECGAMSRSADVQKHIRENCLHYARKAWYKCLHCEVVFKTFQGQKTHIEEKHCVVLHKCSACPLAFKTSVSYEAHLKNKHSANKLPPDFNFKCSCGSIFKKKSLLFQHFHQDANKRLTCVFKCPECNSVFSQKQLLMQHFKSVHGGESKPESEVNSTQTNKSNSNHSVSSMKCTDGPRKKAEKDTGTRVKPSGWTCGECLQWFPERDLYISHLKSKHGKSLKRFLCRQCDQSFNSNTSLRRHIRSDHDGKKKIYTCWLCTDRKTFTNSVMLKNHISLMHGIKNPDLGQMPKTTTQARRNVVSKDRGVSLASVQEEGEDSPASLEAPSAKRVKTTFRCSKCGFATGDDTKFQAHIARHKSDDSTPQCLHCGLCFTSPLSLSRHLFIVHKVKDLEQDEERNSRPEAHKQTEEDHLNCDSTEDLNPSQT